MMTGGRSEDPDADTSLPSHGELLGRRAALGAVAGLMSVKGLPTEARSAVPEAGPFEDVKTGGAVGDGKTDDTASIQAAIDRAHSRGGGIVLLPPGHFLIAGTLQGRRGVSIQGMGSLASRLMKVGPGDCLIYGEGSDPEDEDIERVSLQGFAITGERRSGHLFWGRKAATAFILKDMYIEGGNNPVALDSCYSLILENVQVRGAFAGDNITINAISHNILLIQVASQVANAGAGIRVSGSNAVVILGGKLEFNKQDQLVVEGSCRGVSVLGIYVEGIQPTRTGYAGIAVGDADTVIIQGGFFDGTQGSSSSPGPMGTDGTATYVKAKGRTSRLVFNSYGFASIAPTQRHIDIGALAYATEAVIPFGASFTNQAPARNAVRFSSGENEPCHATQTVPQPIPHDVLTTLVFTLGTADRSSGWKGSTSFVPVVTSFYAWSGFIQLVDVAAGSEAALIVWDAHQNVAVAQVNRTIAPGYPTLDFAFRERLLAGRPYQLRLIYKDAAGQDRATSGHAAANRMLIERLR